MEAHLSIDMMWDELEEAGQSPQDSGSVEMIVCRPQTEQRDELQSGELSLDEGLVGDNWKARGSSSMPDGSANPDAQVTLMNSRVVQVLAGDKSRWALAGDQLFVDFDISVDNCPAGQQIQIGDAILEFTALPHTGCKKFASRYGVDATKFVMSETGKQLRLRGANVKVVRAGRFTITDTVIKL